MAEQISMWDMLREPFKVTKKIRLVTLFSGYDSQAMALKRLGVDFEHYKAVELDKYAIASLNVDLWKSQHGWWRKGDDGVKFWERNKILSDITKRYAEVHDKYTNNTRILTDEEWKDYKNSMDTIAEEYKKTNMSDFSGKVCMAYLDDTEIVQKKLKEVKDDG